MYTYTISELGNMIVRSDGAHIPMDPDNTDYANYLAWVAAGNVATTPTVAVSLADLITQLTGQVDSMVADIYSNWTRFSQEYLLREAAAQAFTTANYVGDPGIWISSYAAAAGLDTTTATKNILAQAAALNSALEALGAARMHKYDIMSSKTPEEAQTAYNAIVQNVQTIAAAIS